MQLTVIDRDENEHEIETAATGTLMEALRELEYGVAAICGGMCSCATCHVYIEPAWSERLEPPQSDERDLLAELQSRRETSRLSCQIQLNERLGGLRVTLAPDE